jgi:hypothetical protein
VATPRRSTPSSTALRSTGSTPRTNRPRPARRSASTIRAAVISFEDSPEDAETLASVAEANGETTVVEGSIAVTIPADPAAEGDQSAIEECVGS